MFRNANVPIAVVLSMLTTLAHMSSVSWAGTIVKANNTTNLVMGGSWVGGVVPSGADAAQWDSTVTGANAVLLGANLNLGQIIALNPGGAVTINDDGNTLGLNGPSGTGIDLSNATQDVTLKCPVALGSSQTWDIGASRTLTVNGIISGAYKLTKHGSGTLLISGNNSYSGGTMVAAGTLKAGYFYAFGANGTSVAIQEGATLDLNGVALGYGYGNYAFTVGGSGVGGNGAIVNNSGIDRWVSKLTLSSDTTFGGSKPWTVYNPSGTLNGNGYSLTKAGNNDISFDGDYGSLLTIDRVKDIKINAGTLSVIEQVTINNSQPGSIYVNTGGILSVGNYGYTVTIQKPIVMAGGILQADTNGANGNATITTNFSLNATGYFAPQASVLTLNGTISDGTASNGIVLSSASAGTLFLGSSSNSYSGDTTITNGTLRLGANTAIPSGSGKGNVIAATDGILDVYGRSASINGLTGAGTVFNTSAAVASLNVGNNDASSIFSGSMQNGVGQLSLGKNGTGVLTLSGGNTYTGGTTVSAGTLNVANTTGSATGSGAVNVNAGATLSGAGIVGGPVTIGGALSPGNSAGILTVNNQVTFEAGSTFNVEVNGLDAGSGYDQLKTTGPVSLAGLLAVSFGSFAPTGHDMLFLVDNTGSFATTGTFQYADDSRLGTFNGYDWYITYDANNVATPSLNGGNDIAIYSSSVPEPSSVVLLAAGAISVVAYIWRRRKRLT